MDKASLDARFRVVFAVWSALLGGVTLFTGVVWAMGSGLIEPGLSATLPAGLAAKLLLAAPAAMVGGIVYRNGDLGNHADPEAYLNAYQARVIVASALQEGGGLFGLAVCLMAAQPTWSLGVWAITAASMAISRPRKEDLARLRG